MVKEKELKIFGDMKGVESIVLVKLKGGVVYGFSNLVVEFL